MIIKKENVNTIRNKNKSRCLFLILFIIMSLNGFILSQQKQKDKSKIDFEQGASYQSKSTGGKKRKTRPKGAAVSGNGKYYGVHDGYKVIVFKISDKPKKDEQLWEFKSKYKIEGIRCIGDRILVDTEKGTMRGDFIKENLSYILYKGKKLKRYKNLPNGKNYAASEGKKGFIFGDEEAGHVPKSIKNAHSKKIKFYDFISKNLLLTIGGDNIIKVWNTNTYEMVKNTMIHPSKIQAAALTLDRKYLVIGTYDSNVHLSLSLPARPTDVNESFKLKIIDTRDLSIIKEIKGIKSKILDISISGDNKAAAVLKADKTVDIWDLENSYIIKTFSEEPYIDAEFGPLGMTFLLVTETGKIQRYITQGIVVDSRPQYVGERYKINTPTFPIIDRLQSGNTIAILDFSGLLIDSKVAEAISYSFRNRISNYPYISVVERDEMNKILNEQGLQNSGVTTPEKAAEIGKILNAKKLIMGKLSKLGSTLITTIKIVDVESAKIDGGREVECQNYALENVPEIIDILLNILIEK